MTTNGEGVAGPAGREGAAGPAGREGAAGRPGPAGADGPRGEGIPTDLANRLEDVLDSTEGIRRNIEIENVKRDKRIRWSQRGIVAATAVAVFAVVVGVFGIKATRDADVSREERSVASCQQYNAQQAEEVRAEITSSHDLVTALSQGIADPVIRKQQVDAYNKSHDKLIREARTPRDCTLAGIERYLSGTTVPKG